MNKKTVGIALALLALLAVGTTFALTEEEYNFAYKQGYIQGYTSANGATNSFKSKISNDFTRKQPEETKSAYKAGFSQGWEDRKTGKENRFLY
ncbi:MAG: hypothetical protein LBK73_06505 [Treponema sp.]|jgi:hypothetical protein|nr:hypothetical protein [Treponema sp.]